MPVARFRGAWGLLKMYRPPSVSVGPAHVRPPGSSPRPYAAAGGPGRQLWKAAIKWPMYSVGGDCRHCLRGPAGGCGPGSGPPRWASFSGFLL